PYQESRDLGGFILIDRISNETVAFGFVVAEPGAGRSLNPAEALCTADRLRQARNRLIGAPGTPDRRLWWSAVSWRLLSTAGLFGAALALTGRPGVSGVLALGDFALRPTLRGLHARLWQRHPSAALQDGAGI
ncbi:hypothetical protein AB4156_43355, partial [Cupriavidus sp. 2MCAB6]